MIEPGTATQTQAIVMTELIPLHISGKFQRIPMTRQGTGHALGEQFAKVFVSGWQIIAQSLSSRLADTAQKVANGTDGHDGRLGDIPGNYSP